MTARAEFLRRIRRGLGVAGGEPERRRAVLSRLSDPPRGIIPRRGQEAGPARLALFRTMAIRAQATVATLPAPSAIPRAVSEYLRAHNVGGAVRAGTDPRLEALAWERTPQLRPERGAAQPGDAAGISHAEAGVAESGTLVLASGPANPTTLAFLPETHIVVIAAADVAGDYEAALDLIRRRWGDAFPPRAINFITGPSRSADIEQTMVLGAHGPRRLHILLVDPGTAAP